MITLVIRRVLPVLGLGAVMAGLVITQHVPGVSSDAWFHVRIGRELLDGWSVAHPGHLGVYDSADWIATQWLPQEGLARLTDRFGAAGLIWATGTVSIAIAGALFLSCRLLAAPLPSAVATAMAAVVVAPGLSARPQVLSYLLIVAAVAAWLAAARDGKPRYWLVGAAWLWPMVHGMWPVGISLSAVAVAGIALERNFPRAAVMRLAAIPVASIIAAGLTPIGLDAYRALVAVGSRSQYFAEWGPPDFTSPTAAVLAVIFALVALVGLRSQPVPWVHVLLFLLSMAWGLYSLRTTPVAGLIAAPLIASALQQAVPATPGPGTVERVTVIGMVIAGSLAMVAVANHRESEKVVPSWIDARLDALPSGTRVLNDWDTGPYFLYRHPDLNLAMHGYGDVFTDAEIERNVDIRQLRPGWDQQVADLDPDVALVAPDSPMGYALTSLLGWQVIESDEDFALLAPPS